eukprot:CCRYP_012940-RB/>CCRYP_012940-RB protein AED:0.44 eAED:1.00 QI:0/0/0/1/0/0/2/0/159
MPGIDRFSKRISAFDSLRRRDGSVTPSKAGATRTTRRGCRRNFSSTEQERAMSNAALAPMECPKIAKFFPTAPSSSTFAPFSKHDSSLFNAFCKRANPIPTLFSVLYCFNPPTESASGRSVNPNPGASCAIPTRAPKRSTRDGSTGSHESDDAPNPWWR